MCPINKGVYYHTNTNYHNIASFIALNDLPLH